MDNLRRFILVFVAIIFITLSVCGIVLADSYNKSARTEEKDLNVSAATFDPKADPNALNPIQENILFLVGDKDGGETELMLIANFNAKDSTVSFLYLPKDMKFAINSEKYVGNLGMLLAKDRKSVV